MALLEQLVLIHFPHNLGDDLQRLSDLINPYRTLQGYLLGYSSSGSSTSAGSANLKRVSTTEREALPNRAQHSMTRTPLPKKGEIREICLCSR